MRSWPESRGAAGRALLVAAALAACGGPGADLPTEPLIDPLAPPEVLTERRILEFPPSQGATRFVRGWWGWREQGVLRMVPYARPARVEIATLDSRPRTLRFVTRVHRLPETGPVSVLVDGTPIAELPLDPSEVVLPALPVGRHPVDFVWPEGSDVGIEKAELEQALPAGRVGIEERSVSQSGYAAVDFVRRVTSGARLRGRFVPPAAVRAEQSFELRLAREGGGERVAWRWPGPWWRRWRGEAFDVPLGAEDGVVRIRLLALGTGEPARWEDLEIARPAAATGLARIEIPAPPKLVLLYVLDALRADRVGHLRADGAEASLTPTLDRLAAQGVTFLDHSTLAPNTLPSTKTLFTGRAVIESNRKRLSRDGPPLLAELFRTASYRTALLSGNGYVSDFYGVTRGFEHLDKSVLYEFHPKTDYNDNAEWVHAAALDWLRGLGSTERGFLYLHVVHPHTPYDPPSEFAPAAIFAAGRLDGASETMVSLRRGEIEAEAADRDLVRDLYEGGLAYADAELGKLLAAIEERYEPGEVLVLVTSDHGEELFDHEGVLHGYTLYRDQLHVPLVAWWPGTLPPHEVASPTDTRDLYVTLRRLTEDWTPPPLGGRSLWPLLLRPGSEYEGEPADGVRFAAAPGVDGGIYAAFTDSRKLVWAPRKGSQWGMGDGHGRTHEAEYVFDLAADPGERHNLAGDPSLETELLRSRLHAWIELARALQPGAEDAVVDEATERNLRALGYLD